MRGTNRFNIPAIHLSLKVFPKRYAKVPVNIISKRIMEGNLDQILNVVKSHEGDILSTRDAIPSKADFLSVNKHKPNGLFVF